jgi:hypothetical protein
MGVRSQSHDPAVLFPGKKTGTHSTGSCLGLGAGLEGYGKLNTLRFSNPGPSCPQQVATLTTLCRAPEYKVLNPKILFQHKIRFPNDLFPAYLQINKHVLFPATAQN